MSKYPRNDWRDYLAHSWGTEPKQKAREKEYNAEYYQEHKEKWGVGTNTKTSKSDPEWLKSYMSAIEKMRKSSGNSEWLPSSMSDFKSWYKELSSKYPGITQEQAKSAWQQIQRTLAGNSNSDDTASSSSTKADKSSDEDKSSSKSSGGSKSSSSKEKSSGSDAEDKEEEEEKRSKKTSKALGSLIAHYKVSYKEGLPTYNLNNQDVENAFDSFEEFVAEMIELGADEAEITKEDWEDFKANDPRKN